MSYPFVNQHYAQDSSRQNRYGNQEGGYNSYESEQYGRYGGGDVSEMQEYPHSNVHENSGAPDVPEKSEKIYNNEGNSPYGTRGAGTDPVCAGNSIWTHDDKRVMAKRSVPAKLFRVLACVIINAIIVIVSIICLVVIFARPFNVGVGTITPPSTNSVSLQGTTLTFNGSIDFIVSNPNSISSALTLNAKVYDQVDMSQDIGRGSVENAKIDANSNSTITFPYQIRYDYSSDGSKAILEDLASKCGLTGGSTGKLDLTLDIDADIKILSVPVPVSFKQDVEFDCPIPASILKSIAGGSLSSLTGSLSGRSFFGDDHSEL